MDFEGSGALGDLSQLIKTLARDEFIIHCACPVLVGSDGYQAPHGAQATQLGIATRPPTARRSNARLVVLPVRKRSPLFPDMITVGRTSNNDIVLRDVGISRFHAYFRIDGGGVHLIDPGSKNGTWVSERKVSKRGPVRLEWGEELRFDHLRFRLLDPGECWDRVRGKGKLRSAG